MSEIRLVAALTLTLGLTGGAVAYIFNSEPQPANQNAALPLTPTRVDTESAAPVAEKPHKTATGAGAQAAREDSHPESFEEQPLTLNPEAIASLREARVNGDPRTPPLRRQEPTEEPTPEELADPDLYLAYETRQTTRVYRNFLYASQVKIEELTKLVEKARAHGLDEEMLKEGEEKIRKLKEAQAELLASHGDLLKEE